MLRSLLVSTFLVFTSAGASFAAPCSAAQEQDAGKATAILVKGKVSSIVPVTGKQLINLSTCDFRTGKFKVDFRYNFTADAGLYWVEGEADVDPAGGGEVKASRGSDNLRKADAGGTLFASR